MVIVKKPEINQGRLANQIFTKKIPQTNISAGFIFICLFEDLNILSW